MKEQLWSTGQRTGALFGLIHELRWEDQAARDIRTSHITPLETDSKLMLTGYRDQNNALEKSSEQINTASSQMKQAYKAGEKVTRHHKHVTEEIRQADQEFEQSKRQEGAARHQLPRIQQLIDSAFKAGSQ